MKAFSWIEEEMQLLATQGLTGNIKVVESAMGARINVGGKQVINLCSNNYLGLANHPRLKAAAEKAISNFGVGPGAVRTISGTNSLHMELEKSLAEFKETEAVITFQSGFTTNLAVIPAVSGEGDAIYSDELNHASIIDGCRLSKAETIRFNHKDAADLGNKLKQGQNYRRKIIITDGVFSMDGDMAPLPQLAELAEKYQALLIVDDAHGEGVLGDHGRGIVNHFKLQGKVDVEVGTLSKALGVIGGFCACPKIIADWLRIKARPFLFSSGLTPADTAAAIEGVKILEESDELVKKLWKNAEQLKSGLRKLGLNTGQSTTPITPLIIGEEILAKQFSARLLELGVMASAIVYPTVAKGKARIRLMPSSAHTSDDMDQAISIISRVAGELNIGK